MSSIDQDRFSNGNSSNIKNRKWNFSVSTWSLKTKITLWILFSSLLIGIAFFAYAIVTYRDSRHTHLENVSNNIMYQSEEVNKMIGIMEQNVLDLASIGHFCYLNRKKIEDSVGGIMVVDNFRKLPEAVGGGIWFERFKYKPEQERYCFYACYTAGKKLALNSEFGGAAYDYPTQSWYVQIKKLLEKSSRVSWSEIYFDDLGTNSLMATVGAAIYDENNKFVGMATVDWRVQEVLERLFSLRPTDNSFVVLIDPQHDLLVADTSVEHFDDLKNYGKRRISDLKWYPEVPEPVSEFVKRSSIKIDGIDQLVFGRLLDNGMKILVLVPEKELMEFLDSQNRYALISVSLFVLVVICITLYLITSQISRPLKDLMKGVNALGQGNLNTILKVNGGDEIAMLSSTFNRMTKQLKDYIDNLRQVTIDKEKIESELEVAKEIQKGILPKILPPFPKCEYFELDAFLQPAREVGGDLYDFFLVSPTKLCLVIGDVSGKGVPASLFMAVTQTLHRGLVHEVGTDPQTLVVKMNQALCGNNGAELFVTYFFAVLDLETGVLTYCNAGHNPFYVIKQNGTVVRPSKRHGVPLGFYEDQNYGKTDFQLQVGDTLFLYTDGISESKNENGTFFGERALEDALARNCSKGLSPQEIDQKLLNLVTEFAGGAEQFDDITVLCLKLTAMAKAGSTAKS